MQFLGSSTTLLKHLQSISGAVTTSNSLHILDNFLFEINDGQLTVSASDLETTMRTVLNVDTSDSGKIAVPARHILEMLKTFPDQPLSFKIKEENKIEITSDNGNYVMVGQNGEEYPKTPSVDDKNSVTLPCQVLNEAITKTIFATGNDDLRPVMSGVYFDFSEDSVTFVATDAHKLVRYRRKDAGSTVSASFILPKKPLNLLKGNLGHEGEVKVNFSETNAVFTFNDIILTCRLIDGKYPNYEAVIPKENPNVLVVDRASLLSSVKRVSIFASRSTYQVILKVIGTELKIFAEDIDFSNEATERLACNYTGDDIEIAFNSRFFIEMLSNVDSQEIVLEMSQPSRAGILLPHNPPNENEEILMLVMPVMINR
jgi:DNA polymerase-3 subunit beta